MKTKIYVKKRRRSYNENIPSTAVARYEYLFDVCQLFFSDQQPNVQCCIFFFTQHNIWTEIWKHIDSRNNFRNLFSKFSILHEILKDIITDHSSEMQRLPPPDYYSPITPDPLSPGAFLWDRWAALRILGSSLKSLCCPDMGNLMSSSCGFLHTNT